MILFWGSCDAGRDACQAGCALCVRVCVNVIFLGVFFVSACLCGERATCSFFLSLSLSKVISRHSFSLQRIILSKPGWDASTVLSHEIGHPCLNGETFL